MQPLIEMYKEVHQTKGGQEIRHLLITGVFQPTGARVQVPHDDGLPTRDAVERLLYTQ